MTEIEIRKDLKDIRYYYSRQEQFDGVKESVGENDILAKIAIYNSIVCKASPRLYDLYVSLYLQNNTQLSLSDKMGYSIEYISRLNCKLIKFIKNNISKKEECENV